MTTRSATLLLVSTLFAVAAFAAPMPTQSPATETVAPEQNTDQASVPAAAVPTCADTSPILVSTRVEIVIEEIEPKGYCNCNFDADCNAICGDRGGKCLVTIPCEEPTRHNGWCYCGYGTVN